MARIDTTYTPEPTRDSAFATVEPTLEATSGPTTSSTLEPTLEATSEPGAVLPWEGNAIALIDLDAFFAAVEQLDHPEWRGKPVIVGGDADKRGVVSTCSYEARKFGVRSAMASSLARRLCPDAIWTSGNHQRYAEVSKQVMDILQEYSPRIQQLSIDEAFLDISPGRFVRDHPINMAQRIQNHVATLGITCSIGLGSNKTIAKIASDQNKPQGLTVVYPGRELDFLAPLPVRDMSGIGSKAEERLHELGIVTLGDLAKADERILKDIFGKNAQMMRNRALGLEASALSEERDVKSISNEVTFSANIIEQEEIKQAIAMIAAKVGRRLRRKNLAGYTVTLKVRRDDFSIHTAQKTLMAAVDDERDFIDTLYELLPEVWRAGDELRLLGVGVSSFEARPEQLTLFEEIPLGSSIERKNPDYLEKQLTLARKPPAPDSQIKNRGKRRSLVEATDKVKDRFGEDAVRYGRELRFQNRNTDTIAQDGD